MNKTKTLVVLGHRSGCGTVGRAYACMFKEDTEFVKQELIAEKGEILEEFEATSWTKAMKYYKKKYFNEDYSPSPLWGIDEDNWDDLLIEE